MPPEQNAPAPFEKTYADFRSALIEMMAAFRHEANHHDGQERAVLQTSGDILALLESAYSESVWLNHKLERRIMGLN